MTRCLKVDLKIKQNEESLRAYQFGRLSACRQKNSYSFFCMHVGFSTPSGRFPRTPRWASSSQAPVGSHHFVFPLESQWPKNFGQWLCDEASVAMQEHIFALRH